MVGDAQRVQGQSGDTALDGEVSALVEQGDDVGQSFRGSVEIGGVCLYLSAQLGGGHAKLAQHLYQVGGCAATEPVCPNLAFGEGV